MSITYNGKSVLAIYRNGTAVEQALIAWNWTPRQLYFGGVRGAAFVPDIGEVYGLNGLAVFGDNIAVAIDEKNGTGAQDLGIAQVATGWVNNSWSDFSTSGSTMTGTKPTSGGTAIAYSTNTQPVVTGAWYQITLNVIATTLGNYRVALAATTNSRSTVAEVYGSGLKVVYVQATVTGNFTVQLTTTLVGSITVESVSVRQVFGTDAFQSSVALRPLFGQAPASRRNLLTYTEQFDNATVWVKDGTTVAVASSPEEWYLANNGVLTSCSLAQVVSPSGNGIFAIDLKADTLRYVRLRFLNVTNANLVHADLQTGTTDGLPATNLGDGFYRFYLAFTSGADNVGIITIQLADTYGSAGVTPSSAKRIIMRRPQFELGSVATPYQRVGAAVDVTESGVTSYPFIRLDLSDDTLITPGLGSTKNLTRFSEEFDNAAWIKVGTTVVGKRITETTTTGQHIIYQASLTLPSATISVDAKADGRDWLRIALRSGGSARAAYYNLATGEPGTVALGLTSSIQPLGDGVYRCIVSGPTEANGSGFQIGTTTGDAIATHTGDGVSGIIIDRVQTEVGSTATEYEYGGLKGTALVAGRNSTLVESVTLPDGNFTLGPITVTSGAPALLRAVGDIVGYNVINKTLTAKERKYLIEYYKDRGAKGLLVPGPELVINGTFNTADSWTGTSDWIISDGRINVNNGVNGGYIGQLGVFTAGKLYSIQLDHNIQVGQIMLTSWTSGLALGTRTFIQRNIAGSTTYKTVFAAINSGSFVINTENTAATTCWIDNVSIKELRPEEEWV